MGWGGVITFIGICTQTRTHHATLLYVLLPFHTCVMLRCCTLSFTSTHTLLYALLHFYIRHGGDDDDDDGDGDGDDGDGGGGDDHHVDVF